MYQGKRQGANYYPQGRDAPKGAALRDEFYTGWHCRRLLNKQHSLRELKDFSEICHGELPRILLLWSWQVVQGGRNISLGAFQAKTFERRLHGVRGCGRQEAVGGGGGWVHQHRKSLTCRHRTLGKLSECKMWTLEKPRMLQESVQGVHRNQEVEYFLLEPVQHFPPALAGLTLPADKRELKCKGWI